MLSKEGEEIRGKSFVFATLKKIVGEDSVEQAVNKISFTKDKKVIFVNSEF